MVARNNLPGARRSVAAITHSSSTASVSSSKSANTSFDIRKNRRLVTPPRKQTTTSDDDAKQEGVELLTTYSPYPKIDQAIVTMKLALGRYTRANDRRMVLRTLKENRYMKALQVAARPLPMVELEELEMEVAKESIVLNGQSFLQKTKYGRTSTDFLHVLHELCYQLCENVSCPANSSGYSSMSPDTLYYDLLVRLARTVTSSDAFAKLNDILGSNDLMLMNADAERKVKSAPRGGKISNSSIAGAKRSFDAAGDPPIELSIFEEGGCVHAHIVTVLGYGLYRKADVNNGRPWIKMQAELVERSNFATGAQVRHVTIHWPDMYV